MIERTWWESMGNESGLAAERLGGLMREGRVRCVEVQQDRRTIAEFSVKRGASDAERAFVLATAVRAAAGPAGMIRAELADLEAAHVAELLTTVP
jgi:hypothetical protein